MSLNKHAKDIASFVKRGDFEKTDDGILIHRGILLKGEYIESVNGQDERVHANLIPTVGINFILDVALGNGAKSITAFYLAPFANNITVLAAHTMADFAASYSEISNNSQGYSETTRRSWTNSAAASGGQKDNYAARASFTIATSTSVSIQGAALMTDNTKGGSSGTLISASNFGTPRVVYNGDTWECGYRVSLSDNT